MYKVVVKLKIFKKVFKEINKKSYFNIEVDDKKVEDILKIY